MAILQKRKWCKTCERYSLFTKDDSVGKVGCVGGCLAIVLTLGLITPILALANMRGAVEPYRCTVCGGK